MICRLPPRVLLSLLDIKSISSDAFWNVDGCVRLSVGPAQDATNANYGRVSAQNNA